MKRKLSLGLGMILLVGALFLNTAFTGKPVIQHVPKPEGTSVIKKETVKTVADCTYTSSYYGSCQDAENAIHSFHEAHKTAIIVNAVDDYSEYWPGMGVFYYSVMHYTAAHCIVN